MSVVLYEHIAHVDVFVVGGGVYSPFSSCLAFMAATASRIVLRFVCPRMVGIDWPLIRQEVCMRARLIGKQS